MFEILDISTSALVAQRANMDVIAGNIANEDAVRNEGGQAIPYRRRVPLFSSGREVGGRLRPGVRVTEVVEDPSPFKLRPDPGHPDAIQHGPLAGFVRVSNVDRHTEMVNFMMAVRAYEANISVIESAKSMARTTLRLLA